jgi:hypothetical protein
MTRALFTDLYQLTIAQTWTAEGKEPAVFELAPRRAPAQRGVRPSPLQSKRVRMIVTTRLNSYLSGCRFPHRPGLTAWPLLGRGSRADRRVDRTAGRVSDQTCYSPPWRFRVEMASSGVHKTDAGRIE